jgi:biotin carboxylase
VAGKRVRTPKFAGLGSIVDLVTFIADNSCPVVVKPRKQGGSRDIVVIRGHEDLMAFSRRHWRDDLMVEEFVEGDVYHVDAVLSDGYRFVSCSRYLRTCLAVMSGENNGSIQLHPDDEISVELEAFFDDVLAAFDAPDTCAYHLEVFRTPSGELALCEIASRVGGARIPAITRATYGIDLLTTWLRLSCGLPVAPVPSRTPEVLHAAVAIVPQGRPVRVPRTLPFDWVTHYEVNTASGATAQNSTSNLCHAIVKGPGPVELEQRLLEVENWVLDNLTEIVPE